MLRVSRHRREKIGEGHLRKGPVVKKKIARAEEPRRAQVGEYEIFVFAEIFLDLIDVLFGVGLVAPNVVRGFVVLKKRFEFERQRLAHALRQHEIHPAFAAANLPRGLKTENVFAQGGEQILGGGFGFRRVFQVQQVFGNGRVGRERAGLGRRRQKFNPRARGECAQGIENLSVIHGRFYRFEFLCPGTR